jgi:chemotaxis methyl-accepting protein methylase
MNYCPISINAAEFQKFKIWLHNTAGIKLKETYFFREPKHFKFLKNNLLVKARKGQNFRLWCAASSTG